MTLKQSRGQRQGKQARLSSASAPSVPLAPDQSAPIDPSPPPPDQSACMMDLLAEILDRLGQIEDILVARGGPLPPNTRCTERTT